jgi:membrane protein DedA with SNARE-associated domain
MDIDSIKNLVIGFVRDHQAWAPFIVAALAFGESLAFVSLLVPATVILLAIGALIGAAGIPFWQVWLGAMLGAVAGDTVSYFIGRHFKDSAYRVWPLSQHPQLVERGERLFARWGSVGVFVGRFFGPARAVVPLIAGIFAMPLVLFQAVNFSSASVWAVVVLAPGAGLMHYWPF